MCNVSVTTVRPRIKYLITAQRRRRSLSILTDGKCLLDRQTLRYPFPPHCAQQRRMERTKGVRTSGPQGWVIVQVK